MNSHSTFAEGDDPIFDRFTSLTAGLLDAPILFVCLADGDSHRCRGLRGLKEDDLEPRIPFCEETIASGELTVVADARADARFSRSPLVARPPGIRFFAGAPLINSEGVAVGALCLMDVVARPGLTGVQAQLLRGLASALMEALELRLVRRSRQSADVEHAERLAALGKTAGRLSHDLKSLLTVILGHSNLLLSTLEAEDPRRNGVEEILKAAERASQLTRGLAAFSLGPAEAEKSPPTSAFSAPLR